MVRKGKDRKGKEKKGRTVSFKGNTSTSKGCTLPCSPYYNAGITSLLFEKCVGYFKFPEIAF